MSGEFKLKFGTGGLRAVMGLDDDQMNERNIRIITQGVSNWVIKNGGNSVAISFDSRNHSEEFAKNAAETFIENGIDVWIYQELMPTPCLSFAVRELKCSAGVMITASHNPKQYNGYKVYNSDGCQVTDDAAMEIASEIGKEAISTNHRGKISAIDNSVMDSFIDNVLSQRVTSDNTDISIVYSPLNGAGLKPVTMALKKAGYSDIFVVPEQREPDGNFPTIPKPNPEEKEAMSIGLDYAKKRGADLLIATDPDSDRVGIAVEGKLMTGNQVGCLLLDYICANCKLPDNPYFVKTIVTTTMAEKIAASYDVKCCNTLTGFKYIGEQIGLDEKNYVFGFEESFGYLRGSYVRDKDAVVGALLICDMVAYYKSKGETLWDRLNELYKRYGKYTNILETIEIDSLDAVHKMMNQYRNMENIIDYNEGIDGLPKSNVLKIYNNNGWKVIRPSGTEPKIKIYSETVTEF